MSVAVACLGLLAGVVVPSGVLAGPARADQSPPGPIPRIEPIASPYGNPYNSYLRQPYGVLPQGNAGTPPVQDNPGEPFDWYRSPRAALGVFGGVQETMISPEGFLQNDFGTLQFYTGDSLTPINQRVKTWQDGWLPVAEYTYPSGGASYHVEAFDTTVPGVTKIPVSQTYGVGTRRTTVSADVDNMITFARVTVTNTTSAPGTFTLGVGLNSQTITNPVHRGAPLPSDLSYDPGLHALTGTGSGGKQEAALAVSTPPTTDVGGPNHTLSYRMTLAPGTSQSVTVMLPYWMAQASDLGPIENASYAAELAATDGFWTSELAQAGSYAGIPEAKVEDTYRANIVALLIDALDIVGDHWYLIANPTIYDGFFMRDSAFHLEALLDAGFSGVVRHILTDYPAWQDPVSGRYVGAQSSEFDSNGEALWSIGQYEQFTHDAAFASYILPSVQASMDWEWGYRQSDPSSGGLYPVNQIGDDEQVSGHITGFNLWAISGEQGAVTVAQQAGDTADASLWQSRATQYAQILRQKLEPAFNQIHVVPPSIEGIQGRGLEDGWYGGVYGIDWGNLGLVWPSGVFSPDDPMVTASLQAWQQKMFEGIFTYPAGGAESLLHSYAPLSIPETYTRAGDQLAAVRYLYDTLVHTSAMGMASEGMNAAGRWDWGTDNNTEPHNQFSAEFAATVHDMLAYSGEDGSLDLANAYSPAWTTPGKQISFAGPTAYGPASFAITMARGGMTMSLDPPVRNAPSRIVIHTPPGTRVTGVTGASGAAFSGDQITLPALTNPATLHASWKVTSTPPPYSFGRAVQDYLANYHQMTSPANVQLDGIKADHPSVRAGYPLQVKATVVNTGGAARLDDPRIVWYIDGNPVATDSRSLANGIGFTTPKGVISFDRNTEGVVPVGMTTTLCAPGMHTIGVGLGDQPPAQTVTVNVLPLVPSQDAPQADLALHASPILAGAGTATATITNLGCATIIDVRTTLQAPEGWTVTPTSPTTVDSIDPGRSATVTWQVQPPADFHGGSQPLSLTATASYGWRTSHWVGKTTGSATGTTTLVVCNGSPPAVDPNARAQWDFTLGCAGDLSGHGEDGTVGPGVTFTDAGAQFNGTDDGAITVPYDARYQPETITSGQVWTLDLTGVVPNTIGPNYQALANARSTSGFPSGWTVYITPGGSVEFWMSQVGGTYAVASSGVQVEPGKQYDITAKWDGSRLSITVSGAGSGSGSTTIGPGYLANDGGPLTFGRGRSSSSDDYFYTGTVAAAKISVG